MEGENKRDDSALDISKVVDLKSLKVRATWLMIKLEAKSKSTLLLPESARKNADLYKAVVYKVGESVKDVAVGDVILAMMHTNSYPLTKDGETYIICDAYNILLSTSADNYNE